MLSSQTWLTHPMKLTGQTIDLLSLEKEHLDSLYELAKDKRIWEYFPFDGSDRNRFNLHYTGVLSEREKGNHYPFIIFNKQTNQIIGSTSLYDIHLKDRNLEIGWTWLHPDYWATNVNPECKYLLLTYCFDHLKCVRVQFRTNTLNFRSQKAIEKIGAKHEGILRNNKIRDDGTIRSSVYYSIIEEEWEDVQHGLLSQFKGRRGAK
jgi:RimJ/RimL family protein N-acetyltransferase